MEALFTDLALMMKFTKTSSILVLEFLAWQMRDQTQTAVSSLSHCAQHSGLMENSKIYFHNRMLAASPGVFWAGKGVQEVE